MIAGIVSYAILNSTTWVIEKLSGGRIVPYAKEIKDPWTWKIPGGFFPRWTVRLVSGKKKFWESDSIYGDSESDIQADGSNVEENDIAKRVDAGTPTVEVKDAEKRS